MKTVQVSLPDQSTIQNLKSKIPQLVWIAEKALVSYTLIAILDVQRK
jgi:hypothetical protein